MGPFANLIASSGVLRRPQPLTTVAVLVTAFRLCVRTQQKRLGIDDAWAVIAVIFDFTLLLADCLYLQDYGERLRSVHVAYILLKRRRKIPSKHKDSIILHNFPILLRSCMVIEVIHVVYYCATHNPGKI